MNQIILGDCLVEMQKIEDKSIDLILCDLPYGTTACKWDIIIPFDKLWEQYNRIIKDGSVICLFGTEPFSSHLRISNLKRFKYDWIWYKNTGSGFALSKYRPLQYHEIISVFSNGVCRYYPIKCERFSEQSKRACKKPIHGGCKKTNYINITEKTKNILVQYDSETKSPESILQFKSVPNGGSNKIHSAQKPVDLLEYLIKTYTSEGDLILDNCAGSGSTLVAARNLNRQFIGIEKEEKYYNIILERLKN